MGLFSGILSGISDIAKVGIGLHQNHLANQINPIWNQYKANPLAKDQLSTAQNYLNGRMAGAANEERNIAASQSNLTNSAERNATDSSQALALAAAGQGQANDAYNNLQTKEALNKYNMLNNYNNAVNTNINEGDKEYQSMLQKYQMDMATKNALRQSAMNSIFGAMNDAQAQDKMGQFSSFNSPGGSFFGSKGQGGYMSPQMLQAGMAASSFATGMPF